MSFLKKIKNEVTCINKNYNYNQTIFNMYPVKETNKQAKKKQINEPI